MQNSEKILLKRSFEAGENAIFAQAEPSGEIRGGHRFFACGLHYFENDRTPVGTPAEYVTPDYGEFSGAESLRTAVG